MKTKPKRKTASEPPKLVIRTEALTWPTEPEPQPVDTAKELAGKPYGTLYVGWWTNAHADSTRDGVGQGCCSIIYHSTWSTEKTNSKGTGRFYATKRDALLVLRWEHCRRAAKRLMEIDDLLKNEKP